jgi:hypothetical protein
VAKFLNTKLVSFADCDGGGQVWYDRNFIYVSHQRPPCGTTIYDVSDPKNPVQVAELPIPLGWHSHKVRVQDGIMIRNYEKFRDGNPEFGGGLGIYDVSNPTAPRELCHWRSGGDFDGRYAYISPTAEGFIGNIVKILDLADPANPVEVGKWWIPGQNVGAGETYPWEGYTTPRCHHPLRMGDRLYVSYWHHGMFILDISDMSTPKLVSGVNSSPAHPHPTHTCLPIPGLLKGRKILVVADEDVAKLRPSPPAFAWVYDITHEAQPMPIATIRVPGQDDDGSPQPPMMGCHQPSERFKGSILPFAWFAKGLRLMDIADPFAPKEVGYYEPDAPDGYEIPSSNDVTIDDRGLIYLVDRQRGLSIIETSVF